MAGLETDLTGLIYLLDSKGCFGNVPLTQLASYISNAFNAYTRHEPFEDILRYENPKQPDTVA